MMKFYKEITDLDTRKIEDEISNIDLEKYFLT